jgi:hypothetical protein
MIKIFSTSAMFLLGLLAIACNKGASPDSGGHPYNRKFAKAFERYSQPKDSLKLRALHYLVDNLDDQYYHDSPALRKFESAVLNGKERSASEMVHLYDSLYEACPGILEYRKDADFVTSDFLIENIDQAFAAWQRGWGESIPFNDFCEYILPYKSADERPEYWRKEVARYYKGIIDSNANNPNPILAANQVNSELAKWYKVSLTYNAPADVGFKVARRIKTGSCDNSSKMAIYAMKALGLPVALDYVPHWANRSGDHSWNALIINNNAYTFNAAEGSIGSHKVEFIGVGRMKYKRAKVFRRTFASNKKSLYVVSKEAEAIPELFENPNFRDVTDWYVPTSSVAIETDEEKNRFAYLCVFDNRRWVPVHWGEIRSGGVSFDKMGRGVAYMPATYSRGKMLPISNPVILTKKGEVVELRPNLRRKIPLSLSRKYPDDETNKIKPGDRYELFYWNRGWVSLGKKTASGEAVNYAAVPSNALYWLRDLTEGKQERIFTYENGTQVWW